MPRALVCLDEIPAPDGTCAVQAWQEVIVGLPPMSLETAQDISSAALFAWAAVACLVIIRRAA